MSIYSIRRDFGEVIGSFSNKESIETSMVSMIISSIMQKLSYITMFPGVYGHKEISLKEFVNSMMYQYQIYEDDFDISDQYFSKRDVFGGWILVDIEGYSHVSIRENTFDDMLSYFESKIGGQIPRTNIWNSFDGVCELEPTGRVTKRKIDHMRDSLCYNERLFRSHIIPTDKLLDLVKKELIRKDKGLILNF